MTTWFFQDANWVDDDYEVRYRPFTIEAEFNLPKYVSRLHKRGIRFGFNLQGFISASEHPGTYPPMDLGLTEGIFVKDGVSGEPFLGYMSYNNGTYWPDFTHPNITNYWGSLFYSFHKELVYDGVCLVSHFIPCMITPNLSIHWSIQIQHTFAPYRM